MNTGRCQGGLSSFDPDDIYLQGTTGEGGPNNVLGPIDDPTSFGGGIEATPFFPGFIRPDGVFVYAQDVVDGGRVWREVRAYRADPFVRDERFGNCRPTYVEDPSIFGCEPMQNLKPMPDGTAVARCGNEGWITEDGTVLAASSTPILYFGGGSVALTSESLLDLSQTPPSETPLSVELEGSVLAVRGNGNGFIVATRRDDSSIRRFGVAADGTVTEHGTYTVPEQRYSLTSAEREMALTKNGDLYMMARDNDIPFNDVIVKLQIGGDAEIVFDEQLVRPLATEDRFVNLMHISTLTTGW